MSGMTGVEVESNGHSAHEGFAEIVSGRFFAACE
jgi:hypothetical protein